MTFHFSEAAKQGNKALAGCILIAVPILLYALYIGTDGLTRIILFLMVITGGGWSIVTAIVSMAGADPLLTINDEGLMVSGWNPEGHVNNWDYVLAWQDFSRAVIIKQQNVMLRMVFYHRIDKQDVIRTIEQFGMFEKQDEIIRLIEEKSGITVLTESAQK
jgi:hypothetical protein